jgi:uncharacterized protein (TIGR02594 family)
LSGRRKPGSICATNHPEGINDGTLCRQTSPKPTPVGTGLHELWTLATEAVQWAHEEAQHAIEALHHVGAKPPEPDWMRIARQEIGVKAEPGYEKNSPKILRYLATFPYLRSVRVDDTHTMADVDETPWCACFVNWCLLQAGKKGGPSARAKDWLNYGEALKKPRVGAITIVHHTPGKSTSGTTSSGNHVSFYIGGNASSITLLGGNQSHSVCEKTYTGWTVLGYRWPK